MRKRSRARECALQILYQVDIAHDAYTDVLDNFWRNQETGEFDETLKSFTSDIVRGVAEHLKEVDDKVVRYAANWQLERMAVVDRNILRMGCYELAFREDIPPKVSINEAVELAKKYSGQEAGKFVNAILDKIRIEVGK